MASQSASATLRDILVDHPGSLSIEYYEERGVDVPPVGFLPIKIRTAHMSIEFGLRDFSIRDLIDKNNEPTAIPATYGSLKSIPTFYNWIQNNRKS